MIFPNQYNEKFIELASKQDEDFDIVDLICEDMIEDIVTKHVLKLDTCANDALEAMVARDEEKLSNVIKETAALKKEIGSLKKTVYEDILTSVYNRKWLDEQYLNESHGSHGSFVKEGVLVIVDLNDFKFINDNFGHITGDKVLVFFAKKLKKLGGDVIRYGGDEFLVLFEKESSIEKIKNDLHILRELLYKRNIETNGHKFKLSFSYGLSTFRVNQLLTKVLGEADSAMYVDKEKFKSRIK